MKPSITAGGDRGLGVVLVPLFLTLDDIAAGRLCTPFGSLASKQRRYFAHAARHRDDVDAFIAWLIEAGRDTEQVMARWAEEAGWSTSC